jgi:acyl carrier protein
LNDIQERVNRCFSDVFPDLPNKEIPLASMVTLAGWNSLAHLTLLSSIAEEFGESFEPDDYEVLVSYPLIVDRMGNQANHKARAMGGMR